MLLKQRQTLLSLYLYIYDEGLHLQKYELILSMLGIIYDYVRVFTT